MKDYLFLTMKASGAVVFKPILTHSSSFLLLQKGHHMYAYYRYSSRYVINALLYIHTLGAVPKTGHRPLLQQQESA